MKPIKFRPLTRNQFMDSYSEALADEEVDDLPEEHQLGEVQIPGYGWHGCAIVGESPTHFWNEDDGWQRCPRGEFVKVDTR